MSALTVADNKGGKRPQYKDYVTFLGNYKSSKKDDQCSVTTSDSGVSFSLNNSSNNSSSSINSDLADFSKNGFKDYLEHYNNKKYSPVQPAFIKKHDIKQQEEAKTVKTEVFIEINNPPCSAAQVTKVITLNNGQNHHNQSSNVSKVSKIFASGEATSKVVHSVNKVNTFNFEQNGVENQGTMKRDKKKTSIGEISKKFEASAPNNPPVVEIQKVQLKKTISISEKSKLFEENTIAHNNQPEIKKQTVNGGSKVLQQNEENTTAHNNQAEMKKQTVIEGSKIFEQNEESTTTITNGFVYPKPPINTAKPVIVPKSFTENNNPNLSIVLQKSPTPLQSNFAPPPPPPMQVFVNIPPNRVPSLPRQSPTPLIQPPTPPMQTPPSPMQTPTPPRQSPSPSRQSPTPPRQSTLPLQNISVSLPPSAPHHQSLQNPVSIPPPPPPLPVNFPAKKAYDSPPRQSHTLPRPLTKSVTSGPASTNGKRDMVDGIPVPVVDKNDPRVKRLVYGALREMYGAYHDKANDYIATLPRNRVKKNNGLDSIINSIASQGGLEKLNGRANPTVENE